MEDYWTKQHDAAHHRNVRPEFLTPVKRLVELRRRKSAGKAKIDELRAHKCLSARVC